MTAPEAREFQTQIYNAGAQYEGKAISPEEFQDFKLKAAQFATAKQLEPNVAGDLAGTFLGFKNYLKAAERGEIARDQQAETALGDFNAMFAVLQRGKGEAAVLARQAAKVGSAALNEDVMKGTFQTPTEVATAVSIAAEYSAADAAEQIRAASRGLRDFEDKKTAPLLKEAGITGATGFTEGVKKLAPIVKSKIAEDQKKGVVSKPIDILKRYFADTLTAEAIFVQINKGVEEGGYADREAVAKANQGAQLAERTITQFMASDTGQQRIANADVALAQQQRAAKNSELTILRQQALATLVREEKIDTNATNINDFLSGKATFGMIGDAEQKRIDDEVQRTLIARSPAGTKPGKATDLLNVSPLAREQDLRDRIARIKEAGGAPLLKAPGETERVQEQREASGGLFALAQRFFGEGQTFAGPSTPEERARQMPAGWKPAAVPAGPALPAATAPAEAGTPPALPPTAPPTAAGPPPGPPLMPISPSAPASQRLPPVALPGTAAPATPTQTPAMQAGAAMARPDRGQSAPPAPAGAMPEVPVPAGKGDEVVGLLKSIDRKLTPRPAAPNPRNRVGAPITVGRP